MENLLLWEFINERSIDVTNIENPGIIEILTFKLYRALIKGEWIYKEIKETRSEKCQNRFLLI